MKCLGQITGESQSLGGREMILITYNMEGGGGDRDG